MASGPSDTTSASSSEGTAGSLGPSPRPVPSPPSPLETSDPAGDSVFPPLAVLASLPSKQHPLPSPRTVRAHTLAHSAAPIRRKPLSATASPLATRYSSSQTQTQTQTQTKAGVGPAAELELELELARPDQRFARSFSLDSPTLYEFPGHYGFDALGLLSTLSSPPAGSETSQSSSPVSQDSVEPQSPTGTVDLQLRNISESGPTAAQVATRPYSPEGRLSAETTSPASPEFARDLDLVDAPRFDSPESRDKRNTATTTMSLFARKSPPPHLTLGPPVDTGFRSSTITSLPESSSILNKPLPKSPAFSNLATSPGWAASPSSSADFSDGSFSPLPSPYSLKPATVATGSHESTPYVPSSTFTDAPEESPLRYCEGNLQTPPVGTTPAVHTTTTATPLLVQLEEMEDELKAISAELAGSIRREMDLEDLVDRLQEQINNPRASEKRTSDYYSDSGYSSTKFSEYDHVKEEISQVQRRAEQEKAQIRLELTDKLQDERSRRRELDQQIQELSRKASQIDLVQLNSSSGASGRVRELENTCNDLRRKLSDERQVKDNFEGLLSALKGELENATNERDNLRDEIVPQLRARVEGLEAEAAEGAKLAYETSKMQQELQSLRSENTELKESESRVSIALSRSASVATGSYKKMRPQSVARSNTVKQSEPREVLADRLQDVEAQRDALHNALKNLLERQEFQNRENSKRIRQLEIERDRLLAASPRKAGYEREVCNLREEISTLRRRAEEAIEQKWQVEKGLSGLKMDLDRAEEEVASLRSLLREKDILIPEAIGRSSSSSLARLAVPVTSASLERTFKELQSAYSEALERVRTLEESTTSDEKTRLAIEHLEQSLSAAVSDRDLARDEVATYRTQLESLQASEKRHLDVENDLADQLRNSACRVEELAQQVRAQLETNETLRTRLSDTIARGEADQRVSTERIASLQSRLRELEEQVIAAQTSAEERVARHEEELTSLKDAHNIQLQRLRDGSGGMRSPRSPRLFPPKSPLTPLMSLRSGASGRSPRMSSPLLSPGVDRPGIRRSSTSPLDGSAGNMAGQVEALKGRVAELEGALASADAEMQEVVGRMNTAQIEVMMLQEEREEAMRETRRLQRVVEAEKVRVFEDQFKNITTQVR
ncbi:hypothetical protein B0T26DRAFT_634910 [Lasiosphaeria miniovina]|uniref:DUF7603 domain-containing protein n=1 Tax=Lasiosphaeria miniovina TaxID=1954250 RepID=A0AA40BHP3_9PEZI|nr:uncharacterized protein B0T26DRAFT_634910 [Lasiosphaeria miniovina]KAK0734426.1 hypothetical protein B0T26DRAFT_634910 [Lasiosphaeria miniovina]